MRDLMVRGIGKGRDLWGQGGDLWPFEVIAWACVRLFCNGM